MPCNTYKQIPSTVTTNYICIAFICTFEDARDSFIQHESETAVDAENTLLQTNPVIWQENRK